MKTIRPFLFFFFILISTVCFSQLKVDSSGKTIFGNKAYTNGISIADLRTSSGGTPFVITRRLDSDSNDNVYLTRSTTTFTKGLLMHSNGDIVVGNNIPTSLYTDYTALRIYSQYHPGLSLNMSGPYSNAIKINATTGYNCNIIHYNSGGSNSFYVKDNGEVYARGILLSSDRFLKREIETITNPLDKVLQLRGVTYFMDTKQDENPAFDDILKNAKKSNPEITSEILKQILNEKKRKNIGVIAQEVEKILPEAVSTREDGLKAVSYSDLTVLLIEAVKEQQSIIDNLKLEVAAIKGSSLRSADMNATGISNELILTCKLSQNAPNPFTERSEIKYYVADGVKNAFICIFDMQGKMLQKLDAKVGQNSLFIEGSKLDAGMYLYSLIADEQEVDTKRMILTK